MNLESPKIKVNKSSQELFDFLSKAENFEKIMPENTDKFEAREDGFTFALKGMPEIKLKMLESDSPKKIVLGSASDKFPFSLTADIQEVEDRECEAQLLFSGEFNPMVAMMVKNPLQRFIDTLIDNISKS
jgi:hypothetical protein